MSTKPKLRTEPAQHLVSALTNGLVFRGPDALDVLNISEHSGLWPRLDGCVGFDAGSVIDAKPDDDDTF